MLLYFTGTGNSRFVANFMASRLGDEAIDCGRLIKDGIAGEFISQKPYVIIAPIYSWRMPAVMENFLRNAQFNGNKKTYFLLTCGGDMGAYNVYAKKLCEEKELSYGGCMEVVMPDNYILMFKAPDVEESKSIIRKNFPSLAATAAHILKGLDLQEKKVTWLDKFKSGIINDGFQKYFVKADGFHATSDCVGCGKCVQDCMLNNITLSEGKPVWGECCTQCMACICGCPKEAIQYGKRTYGKARYQCPEHVEETMGP